MGIMTGIMNGSPIRTFAEGILIDQPWGKLTWLASREMGNSTTMTLGHVIIPADQTNPRHRHPNCDEILHLLGLDHTKLTYRHSGRDFRLTDVHGNVITDWVA